MKLITFILSIFCLQHTVAGTLQLIVFEPGESSTVIISSSGTMDYQPPCLINPNFMASSELRKKEFIGQVVSFLVQCAIPTNNDKVIICVTDSQELSYNCAIDIHSGLIQHGIQPAIYLLGSEELYSETYRGFLKDSDAEVSIIPYNPAIEPMRLSPVGLEKSQGSMGSFSIIRIEVPSAMEKVYIVFAQGSVERVSAYQVASMAYAAGQSEVHEDLMVQEVGEYMSPVMSLEEVYESEVQLKERVMV